MIRRPTNDRARRAAASRPPPRVVRRYYALLDALVVEAIRDEAHGLLTSVPRAPGVLPARRQDSGHDWLAELKAFAQDVTKNAADVWGTLFGRPIAATEPTITAAIPAWQKENVDLITDLTVTARARVRQTISEGTSAGLSQRDLTKEIQADLGVARARARLIARDQTLKLNAQATRAAQEASGFTRFRWLSSLDERVRQDHAKLHGKEFRWDSPPRNDRGEEIWPGTDYQCRCTAYPVDEDLDDLPPLDTAGLEATRAAAMARDLELYAAGKTAPTTPEGLDPHLWWRPARRPPAPSVPE